jgi:hypothetical protein
MEIIYVNDHYTADQLEWFRKNEVTRPTEDQLYTIREMFKVSANHKTGVLLEEIKNKNVKVFHPIMQCNVEVEPSWDLKRFSTLSGEPLSREDIESIKQETTVKQIEPCK